MIASLLVSLPLICGQTSFADKSSLESALAEWCNDPAAAASTHGNISTWGVSAVTDMASLVYNTPCRSTFDEDIDDWVSSEPCPDMQGEIIDLKIYSDVAATAIFDFNGIFIDAFQLAKVDGEWRIVNKFYINK